MTDFSEKISCIFHSKHITSFPQKCPLSDILFCIKLLYTLLLSFFRWIYIPFIHAWICISICIIPLFFLYFLPISFFYSAKKGLFQKILYIYTFLIFNAFLSCFLQVFSGILSYFFYKPLFYGILNSQLLIFLLFFTPFFPLPKCPIGHFAYFFLKYFIFLFILSLTKIYWRFIIEKILPTG